LAQRYIGFALRADVQSHWCGLLGAMPVHPESTVPEVIAACTDLPRHADEHRGLLHIDEHLKVRHERHWEQQFDRLLTQDAMSANNNEAPHPDARTLKSAASYQG